MANSAKPGEWLIEWLCVSFSVVGFLVLDIYFIKQHTNILLRNAGQKYFSTETKIILLANVSWTYLPYTEIPFRHRKTFSIVVART